MTARATQEKKEMLGAIPTTAFGSNAKAMAVAVEGDAMQEARKQESGKREGVTPEQWRLQALEKLLKKAENAESNRYAMRYEIPRGRLDISYERGQEFRVTLITEDSNTTETHRTAIIPANKKGEVEKIIQDVATLTRMKDGTLKKIWTPQKGASGEWANKFTDGLLLDALKNSDKGIITESNTYKLID
jgi:hypothetical protein